MNEVLNAEVYFSTFFMWVRGIMLNTFALESSVLMLLNISLSNCVRRHSEGALWEERRRDRTSSKRSKYKLQHRGREMAKWKKRKWKRSVRAAKKEGKKKQEALFQVCFLLSVKAWEKNLHALCNSMWRKDGDWGKPGIQTTLSSHARVYQGRALDAWKSVWCCFCHHRVWSDEGEQ